MKYYKSCFIYSFLVTIILIIFEIGKTSAQSSTVAINGDTKLINKLLKQIDSLEGTDTRAALVLVSQVKKICTAAKADTMLAKAYTEEGFCNFYSGNYKRSAMVFDSAANLWKKVSRLNYLKAVNDKATALMYNAEYHKALLAFFECLNLSSSLHNDKLTGKVLNNLGLVYESIGDPDNAILYEKRAVLYKVAAKDSAGLPRAYGNIGDAFANKEMPDSAIYYEQKSYILYTLVHDEAGMSIALGNIGNTFRQKKMLDSCISYLLRAELISQKLSDAEVNANIEDDLAETYLMKHDLKKTWKYVSVADKYVPQITDNEFLQGHFKLMYQYYKQSRDTAKALSFLEKLNAVNDSIFKQKINIQNEKIAFEYEYKQKKLKDSLLFQSQINKSEQKATASRNRLYLSLLMLLAAILLSVIWYTRSKLLKKQNIVARQNHIMQEQKIKELENEKQLLASQGVLKGQEEERSRLARDLHDGLGGLLSGVKHSIINMKENIIISGEIIPVFEKSLDMIDTAMKELRRVAQNLMPEALAKFGLEEALKDYCASSSTSSFKVIFQSFGTGVQLESATEIIIYRIIQELVNNALKYAGATQVTVQLVKGDDWVTVSVEDNGVGFDINELKTSGGSGWSNIKSRLDYLNGNVDLKSQKGTGTSVNIEIKIPQT